MNSELKAQREKDFDLKKTGLVQSCTYNAARQKRNLVPNVLKFRFRGKYVVIHSQKLAKLLQQKVSVKVCQLTLIKNKESRCYFVRHLRLRWKKIKREGFSVNEMQRVFENEIDKACDVSIIDKLFEELEHK